MTPELKTRQRPAGAPPATEPGPPPDGLARLRAILFGGERDRIRRLEQKIADPDALAPTVERALNASVRRDPRPLAEALFPVMGPAIRRAISQAIAGLMQSVNQTLERSLSWQGLKWRWEAFRTGTSFGEVVLRHSLLYRVEQVLLVHRESGVLLEHVLGEGAESRGRDMVAGMLTAIQDFARDSFGVTQEESLETMQVGDLTVWVEQGGRTMLAAVIRGHAPIRFRAELQRALEQIEAEHGLDLSGFQGDTSAFARSRPRLELLLQAEAREPARPGVPWRTWTLLLIMVALLLVLLVPRFLRGRHWDQYLGRLREEPGLIVTDHGSRNGRLVVRGLRDPLARDPAELLQGLELDPSDVTSRWEPYVALLPQFVLSRATRTLAPPPTVSLRLVADTLVASGATRESWFRRAANLGPALAGVGAYREERLPPRDLPLFAPLVTGIESRRIYFAVGRSDLDSAAAGATTLLAADLVQLDSLSRTAGFNVTVTLVGSADELGSPETNQVLRLTRAATVRDRLAALVPPGIVLATAEAPETEGAAADDEERARRRAVLPQVEVLVPVETEGPIR